MIDEQETVHFTEPKSIRQYINAQRKHNTLIDKQLNKMQQMSSEDRARAEAEIDNSTPGPGLRRGPPRRHERKEREEERPEGTGWGGFPLKDPSEKQEGEPAEGQPPAAAESTAHPCSQSHCSSQAGRVEGGRDGKSGGCRA